MSLELHTYWHKLISLIITHVRVGIIVTVYSWYLHVITLISSSPIYLLCKARNRAWSKYPIQASSDGTITLGTCNHGVLLCYCELLAKVTEPGVVSNFLEKSLLVLLFMKRLLL